MTNPQEPTDADYIQAALGKMQTKVFRRVWTEDCRVGIIRLGDDVTDDQEIDCEVTHQEALAARAKRLEVTDIMLATARKAYEDIAGHDFPYSRSALQAAIEAALLARENNGV